MDLRFSPVSHMESLNGLKLPKHGPSAKIRRDSGSQRAIEPTVNRLWLLLPPLVRAAQTRAQLRLDQIVGDLLSQSMIGALRRCMACCCFPTISSLALIVGVGCVCTCSVYPRSEEETKHRFKREFFLLSCY